MKSFYGVGNFDKRTATSVFTHIILFYCLANWQRASLKLQWSFVDVLISFVHMNLCEMALYMFKNDSIVLAYDIIVINSGVEK